MFRIRMIQCLALGMILTSCIPPVSGPTDIPLIPSSTFATQVPIPAVTLTQTSVSFPSHPTLRECIELSTNRPEIAPKGTLVLEETEILKSLGENSYPLVNYIGHLLNLETMSDHILSLEGNLYEIIGVSPDRTKLLYTFDRRDNLRDSYRLVVADSFGKTTLDFTNRTDDYWWDYYTWLAHDALRTVDIEDTNVVIGVYTLSTNEYTRLKTDWENLYKGRGVDWPLDKRATDIGAYNGINIIYDPTLTRVLYPQDKDQIALADVETKTLIATFQSGIPRWGRLPRWSDDGKNLAIVFSGDPDRPRESDEFFLISRDGDFQKITGLSGQYGAVHISEYSWSPDGRQIAFWLNTISDNPNTERTQSSLAILNLETRQITDLCIQGISAPAYVGDVLLSRIQPIWSPDGRWIVFTQLDPNNAESYNVVIVNVEMKTAWLIDSNKQPIGWMADESQ